jgi:hypothetical protein
MHILVQKCVFKCNLYRYIEFEKFYFLHLNFWFLGNLFTVLHDRRNVVVWVVASVGLHLYFRVSDIACHQWTILAVIN